MSYLDQLKSENTHQEALSKLTKGGFDSSDRMGERGFSEKKVPVGIEMTTINEHLPKAFELPDSCPLLGGPVPDECRFESKFFKRMTREGVLIFGGPCPLRKVCRIG